MCCNSCFGPIGIDWVLLEFIRIHWEPLKPIGIHWNLLDSFEIDKDPLAFIEIHWDPMGMNEIHRHFTEIYQDSLKSTGIRDPIRCRC